MDIYEIVKARHSVRSYTHKKIEGDTLEKLNSEIKECIEESNLNIQLILNEENAFGKSHYGNFKNCKNYILIIGDKKDNKLDEKAGYYGERIVLKAQELGLKDNEKIAIVIAIGYGETEGVQHKSKSFKSVSKSTENLPYWYMRGIEFALLAPTAINQQKFRFELKDGKKVSVKVPAIGICTKIDLGIVKYHFEIGAGKENFDWEQ